MKPSVAIFCHSLVSDWNHGNAHFLRGIVLELQARGQRVQVFEPADGWSRENLLRDHGQKPLREFEGAFPNLASTSYTLDRLAIEQWLEDVDLVLVHEWNDPALIAAIGKYRKQNNSLRLLFHDTHHRAITAPDQLAGFDLSGYDGILAYGESLKQAYERLGWGKKVYVWHEAADVRTFHPIDGQEKHGDLAWIGNWGDEERTEEVREYLIGPCSRLGIVASAFGVRYPEEALTELAAAGIGYHGWLANYKVPETFARFRVTVHVPRRPYTRQLPGIPTIRPFEALACGIPLVCAPWQDTENLFRPGIDFLMAPNGYEMEKQIDSLLNDCALAASLSQHGLETIRSRHTCGHRVDELLTIYQAIAPASPIRRVPVEPAEVRL